MGLRIGLWNVGWKVNENADGNVKNELRTGVNTVKPTDVKLLPVRFLTLRKAEDGLLVPYY